MCPQIPGPPARRSNRLASLQQGPNSPATSTAEEYLLDKPPPAPPQEQADVNLSQASNNNVHHEPSLPPIMYRAYPPYDGFLDGRESSIDGDFSDCGEEEDQFEDAGMDDFVGWLPEMLFTPQSRIGLHQQMRTHEEGESSV
jgi:hypothetical protein